jgi:hypothetical protein
MKYLTKWNRYFLGALFGMTAEYLFRVNFNIPTLMCLICIFLVFVIDISEK